MLKTFLLCGALLFANGEAPIETPKEPDVSVVEPNTGDETLPPVETPTEPEFTQKTYTFKDDDSSAVITLISEKEYTIETTYNDGTKESVTATYEIKENTLILYTPISLIKYGDFTINEDGSLTKIVPEYEIPTNKDEAVEALKTWLSTWASPEMVTLITLGVTFLVVLAVYLFKDAKNKKILHLTNEDVQKNLTKVMESEIGKEIKSEVNKFIPEILSQLGTQNDILKTFAKIMCLAQENTPKSRLAIIELIQSLGVIEKENLDASKKVVENKEKAEIEKAENTKKEIDKIIEETEKKEDGTRI